MYRHYLLTTQIKLKPSALKKNNAHHIEKYVQSVQRNIKGSLNCLTVLTLQLTYFNLSLLLIQYLTSHPTKAVFPPL